LEEFENKVKIGDLVFIPSHQMKKIYYGTIESPCVVFGNQYIRSVDWISEENFVELDLKFHKLLHSPHVLILLNSLSHHLERLLYPIYFKANKLYISIQVEQKQSILSKSLFGFHHLLLEDCIDHDLEIKMNIQSPGIIQLITNHLDMILIIFKVIKIIQLVQKKDHKSDELFLKENKDIVSKYFKYGVDQLQLKSKGKVHYHDLLELVDKSQNESIYGVNINKQQKEKDDE